MKTIGLLGGTGWSSTIEYYKIINQMMNEKLGGFHSAKVLLKSIDYHDIMTKYHHNQAEITPILKKELMGLLAFNPDCFLICCNSLHKYYDILASEIDTSIPIFHVIDVVKQNIQRNSYSKVLFLATKFTMEDGFFSKKLEQAGSTVIIPNQTERNEMHTIHGELMQNYVTDSSKKYFEDLIKKYDEAEAVVIACSEWNLLVNSSKSALPIVDSLQLQCDAAVEYACRP